MSADHDRWLRASLASMKHFFSETARNAPQGSVLERAGLIAIVNTATPTRSLFNSVIYEDPGALARELGILAGIYEQAGVHAWTVWVPAHDRGSAELLAEAGHKLDASPRMMGRELAGPEPHSMEGVDWTPEGDPDDVNEINDAAYGLAPGTFAAGCGRLGPKGNRIYVARREDEPAACVVTSEAGSDCGIWWVATLPEARGRGLSTALMRQALADAAESGLETSTLQASALGRPIYEKLGYGDFGHFEMWERRREE